MSIRNKDLKRHILQISYNKKLSHIGSCLTAADIIDEIFKIKKPDERFCLSSGHAGLALYCVLDKYDEPKDLGDDVKDYVGMLDAEKIFDHHGVHPDRCVKCKIDCSAGSLGNGLPIAVGMALADRSKNVYCLISDGECAEGSIAEALRIRQELNLWNLKVYVNDNGYGAYGKTNIFSLFGDYIDHGHIEYRETNCDYIPFLKGQAGHYAVMDEKMYKQAMEILK